MCREDEHYINDGDCVEVCPSDKKVLTYRLNSYVLWNYARRIKYRECVTECPSDKPFIVYNQNHKKCKKSCPRGSRAL